MYNPIHTDINCYTRIHSTHIHSPFRPINQNKQRKICIRSFISYPVSFPLFSHIFSLFLLLLFGIASHPKYERESFQTMETKSKAQPRSHTHVNYEKFIHIDYNERNETNLIIFKRDNNDAHRVHHDFFKCTTIAYNNHTCCL